MKTKSFKTEYLTSVLGLPESAVEDKVTDATRWSVVHEIVFRDEDEKFYSASYSVGATESQSECPWEYEDEVTATEVVKKPVTIEQWVPVD